MGPSGTLPDRSRDFSILLLATAWSPRDLAIQVLARPLDHTAAVTHDCHQHAGATFSHAAVRTEVHACLTVQVCVEIDHVRNAVRGGTPKGPAKLCAVEERTLIRESVPHDLIFERNRRVTGVGDDQDTPDPILLVTLNAERWQTVVRADVTQTARRAVHVEIVVLFPIGVVTCGNSSAIGNLVAIHNTESRNLWVRDVDGGKPQIWRHAVTREECLPTRLTRIGRSWVVCEHPLTSSGVHHRNSCRRRAGNRCCHRTATLTQQGVGGDCGRNANGCNRCRGNRAHDGCGTEPNFHEHLRRRVRNGQGIATHQSARDGIHRPTGRTRLKRCQILVPHRRKRQRAYDDLRHTRGCCPRLKDEVPVEHRDELTRHRFIERELDNARRVNGQDVDPEIRCRAGDSILAHLARKGRCADGGYRTQHRVVVAFRRVGERDQRERRGRRDDHRRGGGVARLKAGHATMQRDERIAIERDRNDIRCLRACHRGAERQTHDHHECGNQRDETIVLHLRFLL
jgi:hypothetical protein